MKILIRDYLKGQMLFPLKFSMADITLPTSTKNTNTGWGFPAVQECSNSWTKLYPMNITHTVITFHPKHILFSSTEM